jgi:prepilin-type N-terminal cleavage/methylation domain-containing protein
MSRRRSGFTLVELLVVITIILIMAGLVLAVFNTGRSSDRLRSAARIGQSAFLGAKDRALHAKDLRGVRLTRDQTDNTLVNGFVYLQPLPTLNYPAGMVQLERLDPTSTNTASTADIVIVRGFDTSSVAPPPQNVPPAGVTAVDWFSKKFILPTFGRIQIGTQWFTFYQDTNAPYVLSQGNEVLHLQTPYNGTPVNPYPGLAVAIPAANSPAVTIQLGNDLLPFHQPIPLSSNVVIDLKFCSNNVGTLANIGTAAALAASPAPPTTASLGTGTPGYVDIMFSPRGGVSGYLSGLGPMHFLLRDLKDAVATSQFTVKDANGNTFPCGGLIVGTDLNGTGNTWGQGNPNKGDSLVLSVYPQTGLVQVFEVDPTDLVNNVTGAAGADGLADNIFFFAQQGKSAGR